MDKKNILIVMDTLCVGGVEKAALSLLSVLSPEKYDVTLLTMVPEGAWLGAVPSWVRVRAAGMSEDGQYEFQRGRTAALRRFLSKGRIGAALALLARHVRNRLTLPRLRWQFDTLRAALRRAPRDGREYDCAIAYHDGIHVAWYTLHYVKARRRVAWFHSDFPATHLDRPKFQDLYNRFDAFAACSSGLAERLRALLPDVRGEFQVCPNVVNVAACRAQAAQGAGFDDAFDGPRILSVGRLDSLKGFDLAARVCARLVRQGLRLRWYVVGEGADRAKIEALVRELGLAEHFFLLGEKDNPYPFFAACDLYVQPSRADGYCLAVAEARIFNKPIVCTDFAGARSQIRDQVTGRIVACDEESLSAAIRPLLEDPARRAVFSAALANENADTRGAAEGFRRIVDGAPSEDPG